MTSPRRYKVVCVLIYCVWEAWGRTRDAEIPFDGYLSWMSRISPHLPVPHLPGGLDTDGTRDRKETW
jgi:hypothetical protein